MLCHNIVIEQYFSAHSKFEHVCYSFPYDCKIGNNFYHGQREWSQAPCATTVGVEGIMGPPYSRATIFWCWTRWQETVVCVFRWHYTNNFVHIYWLHLIYKTGCQFGWICMRVHNPKTHVISIVTDWLKLDHMVVFLNWQSSISRIQWYHGYLQIV